MKVKKQMAKLMIKKEFKGALKYNENEEKYSI